MGGKYRLTYTTTKSTNMKNTTNLIVAALMCISIAASAQTARPEVGRRLQNQNARIHNGVNNGQLTRGQAHALHQEDRSIHNEIRADRRQNGGRLTPVEKRQVNRQENQVSRQIYNEKHPNAPRR